MNAVIILKIYVHASTFNLSVDLTFYSTVKTALMNTTVEVKFAYFKTWVLSHDMG